MPEGGLGLARRYLLNTADTIQDKLFAQKTKKKLYSRFVDNLDN